VNHNVEGGDAGCLLLPSPFSRENFRAIALNLDTSYAQRDKTLGRLVDALSSFASHRNGNYLVFFPSYQYMNKAHEFFTQRNEAVHAPIQRSGMDDIQRTRFLQEFDRQHPHGMVAFAVMGGIFGEGIDLVGDKVIGVAIVGVGVPQICLERNLIQQYHDDLYEPGYDYAYTIPGFNRVMQAVGRLIRNDNDKGIALLIDKRFFWQKYQELIPKWWQPIQNTKIIGEINHSVSSFWQQCETDCPGND
jgi:DNA excision repair protein ERCC-2